MTTLSRIHAGVLACVATLALGAARAAPEPAAQSKDEAAAKLIAADLAASCPVADPNSSAAFNDCRQKLFRDSEVKRKLPEYVLWGRQRDPSILLKNAKLTQFAPDVLASMYLPLFMFNGKYNVVYLEHEGLYQIRLQTAFTCSKKKSAQVSSCPSWRTSTAPTS